MNNTFKREQKYLVIKVKDAKHYLDEDQLEQLAGIADTIEVRRKAVGLPGLECVVIESHWPEYEATWKAIEARVTGAQAQPAPSVPTGWELVPVEVVALYRFMCSTFVPMTPQQKEIAKQFDLAKRAMAAAPEIKP